MSFIKNLTEKLMVAEYRAVRNLYSSTNIGEDTEYIGFIKQIGAIAYCVIIINTDRKYDYKGFYKDVLSFYSQLEKVIVTGIFVSEKPDDELIEFTKHNIEDYNDSLIDVRWIADTSNNKIIVEGQQPDKILELDKLIKESFTSGGYSVPQDINTLKEKAEEKRNSDVISSNINLTLGLILINGIIEIIITAAGIRNDAVSFGGIYRDGVLKGQWYRLVTYMFIHGGLSHYLGNALSLYILGSRVEKYYGKISMLILYMLSGLGAGAVSITFGSSIAVGASGAIFGLMSAILVYTKAKNRSLEGFDTYFVIIFAIIGIFSGFLFTDVDNFGHLGGFITGIIVSFVMMRGKTDEKIQ